MFNDRYGLTKAVLEGRKTMTRRIIKAPKTMEGQWVSGFAICKRPGSDEFVEVFALNADEGMINNILPKYRPGEVVAVAQRYKDIRDIIGDIQDGKSIKSMAGWNNKMFVRADLMPHQIRITNVRVERLQDISDEDCLREGIYNPNLWRPLNYTAEGIGYFEEAREAFATIIEKVSGEGTWQRNPWVFVYEFELVK